MLCRRALTICLTALTALFAVAETHYKAHVSVGAHGGMGLSRVSFAPSVKQAWDSGMTGGISVRYAEERNVGVLAELNFVQRGWSEDFEESPLEYSRTLNYVSIPIMTHIYFGGRRVKCFFNLGPEFSYLISESTSTNFDINNPFADPDWPTKARMTEQLTTKVNNKFDYGICAGVGVEFYARPRHSVYLEARYYYGLGNIFPASKADTFGASRNMTIAVTLGYNFRIR